MCFSEVFYPRLFNTLFHLNVLRIIRIIRIKPIIRNTFSPAKLLKYIWFDRPCMFNTLLSENVLLLRIIRIKFVIHVIRNTRIKQLSFFPITVCLGSINC